MEDIVKGLIKTVLHTKENIFDELMGAFHRYTSQSVHSLQEMKSIQTTKVKGDLFEMVCKLLLQQEFEKV